MAKRAKTRKRRVDFTLSPNPSSWQEREREGEHLRVAAIDPTYNNNHTARKKDLR